MGLGLQNNMQTSILILKTAPLMSKVRKMTWWKSLFFRCLFLYIHSWHGRLLHLNYVHLKDSSQTLNAEDTGHFLSIVSVNLEIVGGVCILKWLSDYTWCFWRHILILFTVNIFKCDCDCRLNKLLLLMIFSAVWGSFWNST